MIHVPALPQPDDPMKFAADHPFAAPEAARRSLGLH
jgi:hypothetical protein